MGKSLRESPRLKHGRWKTSAFGFLRHFCVPGILS
jgi:hypothetical protein